MTFKLSKSMLLHEKHFKNELFTILFLKTNKNFFLAKCHFRIETSSINFEFNFKLSINPIRASFKNLPKFNQI